MFDFLNPDSIGKEYNGFVLLSIDDLCDYKAKAVYLRHKKTGLEVYHVLKDDKENTFAFAFRTVSKHSKGVAHIMEHSVLCGSEKYPLKEPFSTLANQSVNTFLNAMTYPDKTVYPASSLIKKDYFTMMDVYADAVFFPKLDYETFCQEGHRLELDDNGNLSIQGVVYNEMKGNYSSFYSVVFPRLITSMFPDSFPAFDSGGDPLYIPELTYQEFLDFHQKFYNPDNCLLFLYGDIPTAEQLDYLNEHFIKRIEQKYECKDVIKNYSQKLPLITDEIKELLKLKKHDKSMRIQTYAPETGTTGSFIALCWYTGEDDVSKFFLSEVLSGNDSSPLSQALKELGLGDDVTCFNYSQFQEGFFITGVTGVKKGNEEKAFTAIREIINKMAQEKISQMDIDGALMGMDVNLHDINRYRGPYAISVMEKVFKSWCYGQECSKRLFPVTRFNELKEKISNDENYIYSLIKKLLLDRGPTIEFICRPSKLYFEERRNAENALIQKLQKNLDREKLKADLERLHQYQQKIETAEEINYIPRTTAKDLKGIKPVKFNVKFDFLEGLGGARIPLLISEEDTNGIFYLGVHLPYDRLDYKYFKHIPFFSSVITNLGWNGKKWDECISESSVIVGDLWGHYTNGFVDDSPESLSFTSKYEQYNIPGRQWITLTCQSLSDRAEEALKLFSTVITTMDFKDKKRLKTMIKDLVAEKKSSIVSKGNDYAGIRTRCMHSKRNAMYEIQSGITSLKTVRYYKNHSVKKTLKLFEYMYKECCASGALVNLIADKETLAKLKPLLSSFVRDSKLKPLLPKKDFTMQDLSSQIYKNDLFAKDRIQIIKVPTQTAFTSFVTQASPYLSKEAAEEAVLSTWMDNHVLWDKIRTTGGAYGTDAGSENLNRLFAMGSFRDPTPFNSIKVFENIFEELKGMDFSEEDIDRVIVTIYTNMICPVSPKGRGETGFLNFIYGEPDEITDKKIDFLFSITPQDIKNTIIRMDKFVKNKWEAVVFCDKSVKTSGNIIKLPL